MDKACITHLDVLLKVKNVVECTLVSKSNNKQQNYNAPKNNSNDSLESRDYTKVEANPKSAAHLSQPP
jgi:adenylosuccinate synthase